MGALLECCSSVTEVATNTVPTEIVDVQPAVSYSSSTESNCSLITLYGGSRFDTITPPSPGQIAEMDELYGSQWRHPPR